MIKGLTHDAGTGVMNQTVKYKGNISTGYGPNDGPNKSNSPKACGFFRFMKQVNITKVIGGNKMTIQEYVVNKEVQEKIQAANNGSLEPRRVECMCMDPTPDTMWESYLGKFSASEGVLCKSHGENTVPTELYYEGEERKYRPRLFDGKASCPYKDCPDYKAKKCKEVGVLKTFPLVDLSINPYKFTTRSLNTITSIECALNTMFGAARMAHKMKCLQLGRDDIKFDGLMGVKFTLVHRKIKSGGRDVFITQIEHSEDFSNYVMSTIRTGIESKQKLLQSGNVDAIIEPTALIADNTSDGDDMIPEPATLTSVEDEKEVAVQFNGQNPQPSSTLDAAASKLLSGQ